METINLFYGSLNSREMTTKVMSNDFKFQEIGRDKIWHGTEYLDFLYGCILPSLPDFSCECPLHISLGSAALTQHALTIVITLMNATGCHASNFEVDSDGGILVIVQAHGVNLPCLDSLVKPQSR